MTEPRPDEFRRFHDLLTEHAPDGYEPWYFRCEKESKAPDLSYGSWKDESARLSVEEAVDWMEKGGNVGIAGTDTDPLVNVDIDDEDKTTPSDLKETLIARSRSRTGVHAWYFAAPGEEIPNIPTDNAGEVRANWQYVVAPGSYVETNLENVPDGEEEDAGYYTVEWENEVTSLRFEELPSVFREHHKQSEQQETEPELTEELPDKTDDGSSRKSALFDITASDVVRKEGGNTDTGDRWSSLWHGSATDANMSLSDRGRIQCWRHNVAHGGLQALAVLSEYNGKCEQVGTGHKGSNAGASSLKREDGAHIWHAWKYAKENGYLPDDDPVPYSAIRYLCRDRELCAVTEIPDDPDDGTIPAHAYDMALKTIENHEGLNPGRKPTDEIEDSDSGSQTQSVEGEENNTPDRENPAGSLIEKDGSYGYKENVGTHDKPDWRFIEVCNFTIETLSFIEVEGEEHIELRVYPAHPSEESYDVQVHPTVFNEARKFKDKVVRGRTTNFSNYQGKALNDLRKTVGAQDAAKRKGIAHVGAASRELSEFVTPEGVLTADGWADDPEHRYYSQASSRNGDESIVGEKWALLPTEIEEYDEKAVQKTIELLPQARLPGRAMATLGWFYSVPAKPLIHDHEGEFNHLQIRGKTESGKTSFLQVLVEAFGMKPSPWSASSTNFSLEQLHVGSRGAPVWIDEYKPSDMHTRTVDKLHRFLRTATREGVWTKGQPDQSFMKFRMQSPVVLSGEQQVSEPAVRRRTIQVNLSERATENIEHVEPYSRLAGEPFKKNGETTIPDGVDLKQHGIAYYRFLLSEDPDDLITVWQNAATEAGEILDSLGVSLDNSEFQGAQTIVFGYRLYERFASELGVSESDLPDEAQLTDAIQHVAESVGANGQRREHGDELLELISQAANAGYVKDEDDAVENDGTAGYRVYNPSKTPDEALAVHMPTVYPDVKRYVRDYNIEEDYNLLARNDYVDEYSDLAEKADSHIAAVSHSVRIGNSSKRCVLIDPQKTRKRLGDNFDLSAFGIAATAETENGESPTLGEEDDTTTQRISDVDAGMQAGPLEATIAEQIEPPEWLEGKGHLADGEGGLMPFVVEAGNPLAGVSEDETILIENVKIENRDGVLTAVFSGITEVQKNQTDSTQSSVVKTATDGGAADGKGTEHAARKVCKLLGDVKKPMEKAYVLSKVSQMYDIPPETVKGGIEKAKTDGRIQETPGEENTYELT